MGLCLTGAGGPASPVSARTECKELGVNFRRLGRQTGVPRVHAHRFRYSATYNSKKAAHAHEAFSPADRLKERLRGVDTAGLAASSASRRQRSLFGAIAH